MMFKNCFCSSLHSRNLRTHKLICINNYICSSSLPFLFRYRAEACWHKNNRYCLIAFSKFFYKFLYLIRIFLSTVYHNRICTRFRECNSSCKCIFHSLFKNKAFYSCANHKFLCSLCLLSSLYFVTKVFNIILRLNNFSSK